jgi:hypothetical protein
MSQSYKLITLTSNTTQDSIEQAKGRSHEEGPSQIFMLDDMQFFWGGVWTLSRLKQKKTGKLSNEI